jgi:diacylglycerol kinase (ATP)
MQNKESLKLFFIINPISGGKAKHDWEKEIVEYFRETPHNIEFYILTGKGDKISVQNYITMLNPDRVVAVGGDGTVKMVAELLKETFIPMGIIPAGSANGMAKELEIPLTPRPALDVIVDGICKKIDLIRINEEQIAIHLSDIGLNALLIKYFEQSKKRGMWGYAKAVFRVLWEKQRMLVSIEADSKKVNRSAYMVALANARKYGTGANINPDGDIADGKFEIVVVRRLNLYEMLKALFSNKSFDPRKIEVISTKDVVVTTRRKAYFQIDGEFMGKVNKIQARILPQILHIMVPRPDVK